MHLALPGGPELWICGALLILIFGGRKLPELARAMGSSITQFKKGMKEEPEELEQGSSPRPPQPPDPS